MSQTNSKPKRRKKMHYLRHDGPEHIAAIAPTRSGKGVGLVVPTLLAWPHSVVVYDTKGENYILAAGWRKKHAKNVVLRFDPAEPGTGCHFNPLNEVRFRSLYQIADAQNIVTMIVDPDGQGLKSHWDKTSHAFLTGVVLHALYLAHDSNYEKGQATLKFVGELLADPERSVMDLLDEMLSYEHGGKTPTEGDLQARHAIQSSARAMLNKEEKELSGVLSTAESFLTLYRDPIIAANTADSDFTVDDLMDHDKPVSLFLVVSPANKDRLKPLIRLVLNQIVRGRTRDSMLPDANGRVTAKYKHRLLMLLDEFPSLGRLDVFQESLAYLAGYGIKCYLIMQDVAQLYAAYTRDESIISNCHIRIAYAPNKVDTAEWMSKMTGQSTVVNERISVSGKRFGVLMDSVSMNYDSTQRPLLTPDECMRLRGPNKDKEGNITEPGEMLIFVAGHAPIRGTQILFFRDPTLLARSQVPAPMTDRIAQSASRPIATGPGGETVEAFSADADYGEAEENAHDTSN
jgi:type IV secretion system protein VirD4